MLGKLTNSGSASAQQFCVDGQEDGAQEDDEETHGVGLELHPHPQLLLLLCSSALQLQLFSIHNSNRTIIKQFISRNAPS